MRKSPASEWISVPEAARLKGVTESSVRVAIQTGRLMGGKVGRSYIVRRGDVEAWRPGPRTRRPWSRRRRASPLLAEHGRF